MALGNESGNQVGSIHEKNQRSKISWDYPFKAVAVKSVFKNPDPSSILWEAKNISATAGIGILM